MKRVIALLCVFALLALGAAGYAEDMREQLPDVTLKVKEALGIGDEYTNFSSSNYDGMWSLVWSGDGGEISITCDAQGLIYNYYVYDPDYSYESDYAPRYPKTDGERLSEIAAEFLGRVVSGADESWVLDEVQNELQDGANDRVNMSGRITKAGYPSDITFDIAIDPAAERVCSFYRSDAYMKFSEFAGAAESAISEEDAYALLAGNIALEAVYYVTDPDDMAKLVYMPANNGKFIVRASDGELVNVETLYGDNYGYEYAAEDSAATMAAGNTPARELTEAELKGISVYDDALSVDELDALLREMTELGLTDEFFITGASYYDGEDGLVANINYARELTEAERTQSGLEAGDGDAYDTKYMAVRATDGRLVSVYSYYAVNNGAVEKFAEEDIKNSAQDAAYAFILKYYPEYADSVVMTESTVNDYSYSYARSASFNYCRVYNGYRFTANNIRVEINADTGTVDSLNINWDDGQEFEDAKALISEEEALEKYLESFDLELGFVTLPADAASEWEMEYALELGWYFRDNGNVYAVDAITGECYSRGSAGGGFEYSDISGHAYEQQIALLGRYGVGFSGGEFHPDEAFTVRDALTLIVQAGNWYGDIEARGFEELTNAAVNMGAPDLSGYAEEQVLTRGEFAGLLAAMSGYEKAAKLTGIYACGFADDAEIAAADYAAVAIAYGLGLIDVDSEGNINADALLTRGEAAAIFHNLLSLD